MKRARFAVVVVGAAAVFGVSACIDNVYVSGAPCTSSAGCPPPSEDPDAPVSTTPEQCISTGVADENAFICLPMPLTRQVTACTEGDVLTCQAAGFPIEAVCFEGTCQCPTQITAACQGWNQQTCTCDAPAEP